MKVEKNDSVRIEFNKGQTLVFSQEEYNKILERLKMDLLVKMLVDKPENIYLPKDDGTNKARELYRVLCEQKDISPELKDSYLKTILELVKGDFTVFENFKDLREKNKK